MPKFSIAVESSDPYGISLIHLRNYRFSDHDFDVLCAAIAQIQDADELAIDGDEIAAEVKDFLLKIMIVVRDACRGGAIA